MMMIDYTVDDICQYILDSVKVQRKFEAIANDSFVRINAMDFEKIYADYAASINQPGLTVEEKRQAVLEHVLKQTDDVVVFDE